MTVHFVNLVSWRFFTETHNKSRIIYLDSISIVFLARILCGFEGTRKSGVNFYHANSDLRNGAIFLTPVQLGLNECEFVLPYWESEEDIILSEELIIRLKPYSKVVVGISSNKQDILAELIQAVYPNKVIYCFGAAINTERTHNRFDRFGFTWLIFMATSPLRTFTKMKITVLEFLRILFNKELRNKFVVFINEAVG